MEVLIIGGGGNIGHWLEVQLLSRGHGVTSLVRGNRPSRRMHESGQKINIFRVDVYRPNLTSIVNLNGFDCIIDLILYNYDQALSRVNMLEGFSGMYIVISTVASYRRFSGLNVLSAKSSTSDVFWKYAQDKLAAEVEIACRLKRADVRIARLAHTFDISLPVPFGPSDWTIPDRICSGHPILTHVYTSKSWPLLHSIDAAKRICLLIERPSDFGPIINIASGSPTNWGSIINGFFSLLDKEPYIKILRLEDLLSLYPYWADSVKYHKQFDEIYVGEEMDIFSEYLTDLSLIDGMEIAFGYYRAFDKSDVVNIDDSNRLHWLEGFCQLNVCQG